MKKSERAVMGEATMGAIQSVKKRGRTDKTAGKQRGPVPAKAGPKQGSPGKQLAQVVSGDGTDADIEARCAAGVDGWDAMGRRAKDDTIRLMRHFWNLPVAPRMAIERNKETGVTIAGSPPDGNNTLNTLRLIEAFGSNSDAFANDRASDLISHLSASNSSGCSSEALSSALSSALAFVHGGKATDPVQSSLLVQMVATHDAALRALRMMSGADFVPQAQLFGNLATKLLNTFTRQAETLAKLQRGGEQVIRHIHIDNRGGQAVVAEQVVAGGRNAESREQALGPSAISPALLGQDPRGNVLPMPGHKVQEAVPLARGSLDGRA